MTVKVLVTLPMRVCMSVLIGVPVVLSAVPKERT